MWHRVDVALGAFSEAASPSPVKRGRDEIFLVAGNHPWFSSRIAASIGVPFRGVRSVGWSGPTCVVRKLSHVGPLSGIGEVGSPCGNAEQENCDCQQQAEAAMRMAVATRGPWAKGFELAAIRLREPRYQAPRFLQRATAAAPRGDDDDFND